jgi:hypothetical protein
MDAKSIRAKRISVASVGFAVGLTIGVPVVICLHGVYFDVTALMFGLFGASIALLYAEKKLGLPTAEDLKYRQFWEKMRPLHRGSTRNDRTNHNRAGGRDG